MKRLAVPVIYQPKDSSECGLACIEMVMKHHSKAASRSSILKDVTLLERGVFSSQIGLYFEKKGFDTQIIAMNPAVFTQGDYNLSQRQIHNIVKKHTPDKNDHIEKTGKSFMLHYLRNEGKLIPRVPTIEDIISEIDAGRPLIANMTTRWHCGTPAKFNRHYNVVTGYDSKRVYTNDPSSTMGGEMNYLHHEFLFSVYTVSDYLGCGSVMKIIPK